MLRVLLVTARPEAVSSFVQGLSSDPRVCLDQAASATEALGVLRSRRPHLAIVNHKLPDMDSLDLVREIIVINASVNTAVISPLSDADFHDKSEGLGILCRLPPEPGQDDADSLLRRLRGIPGIE